MGKDTTGGATDRAERDVVGHGGLPGYPSNTSVPGAFELPLPPRVGGAAPVDDPDSTVGTTAHVAEPDGAGGGGDLAEPEGVAGGLDLRQADGVGDGRDFAQPEGVGDGLDLRQADGVGDGRDFAEPDGAADGRDLAEPEGVGDGPDSAPPDGAAPWPEPSGGTDRAEGRARAVDAAGRLDSADLPLHVVDAPTVQLRFTGSSWRLADDSFEDAFGDPATFEPVAPVTAPVVSPVSPEPVESAPPTAPRTAAGERAEGGSAAYPMARVRTGPHADELVTARSKGQRQRLRASSGLRRALGLGPSRAELFERDRIDRIVRPLNGRRTVMVINTKGGGGKTLVTLMLAAYLGRYRSGSVLAWDNNETEGTLGMRAPSQSHHRTVVDLLAGLPRIVGDPNVGTSELEHWVRDQRGLGFDVLASADDDEAMRIIGEQEFEDLHTQLSRFYPMMVIDTGNNRLAPNWLAAARRADLLVFATSLKDDTSVVAAKNLDALVAMGLEDLVRNSVCVISHTTVRGDPSTGVHTREHFEQWVRTVVDIPYDPALAPGLQVDPLKIGRRTHEACLNLAAVVVDGL
ncbi:hypothetical protein [Intrasporangium sp.]|uniref:hypothetical protein n=1 Tax=Intrasporangium sp. TaxID=1925024 RepID=UPI003221D4CE